MAPYYKGRPDFEANLRYLISNQTAVADLRSRLNTSPAAKAIASQGDIDVVLKSLQALGDKVISLSGGEPDPVDVERLASLIAAQLPAPAIDYAALAKAVNDDAARRLTD